MTLNRGRATREKALVNTIMGDHTHKRISKLPLISMLTYPVQGNSATYAACSPYEWAGLQRRSCPHRTENVITRIGKQNKCKGQSHARISRTRPRKRKRGKKNPDDISRGACGNWTTDQTTDTLSWHIHTATKCERSWIERVVFLRTARKRRARDVGTRKRWPDDNTCAIKRIRSSSDPLSLHRDNGSQVLTEN